MDSINSNTADALATRTSSAAGPSRLFRQTKVPLSPFSQIEERVSGFVTVPGGTISDAVEEFGLKLEPRKATVETVVIDQVSKTPTAN